MRTSPSDLEERIAKGERIIAHLRASGRPIPQEWQGYLEKLKALAQQRETLTEHKGVTVKDIAEVFPGSEVVEEYFCLSNRCPTCRERVWWVSIYHIRFCATCHPPAAPELVAVWIKPKDTGRGEG